MLWVLLLPPAPASNTPPSVLAYLTPTRPTSTPSAAATTRRATVCEPGALIRQPRLDLDARIRQQPDPHLRATIANMPSSQPDAAASTRHPRLGGKLLLETLEHRGALRHVDRRTGHVGIASAHTVVEAELDRVHSQLVRDHVDMAFGSPDPCSSPGERMIPPGMELV